MNHANSWRARERRERRRDILDAARAVLAANDYEHTTMEAIAERADVGKGTIYLHFEGGKRQLLDAVFDDLAAEVHLLTRCHLRVETSVLAAPGAYRAALRRFLEAYTAFVIANHGLVVTLVREVHHRLRAGDAGDSQQLHRYYQPAVRAVAAFIEAGTRAEVIRAVDALATARVLLGAVRSHLLPHLEPAPSERIDAAALAGEAADGLVDMFWRGLRT